LLTHTETSANDLIWAEPGYYEDGSFGIRLENVLIVKEAHTGFNFDGKGYLAFEHITWVHICAKAFAFGVSVHVSDSNIELRLRFGCFEKNVCCKRVYEPIWISFHFSLGSIPAEVDR
jgi:hypothetical protein